MELHDIVEAEKKEREALEKAMKKEKEGHTVFVCYADVDSLGVEELQEIEKSLLELRSSVAKRANHLLRESCSFGRK
ncbi:agamous-like MADS-box protein AGL62 [Canna indica]|uniref:Agamous-like MADS-box protein AGL62 n=1 Tax=Canna indica TaxID=4628 RepID=A0AAQ3K7K0_9LILI|nr:agamous-like MADS-box protein AGL62 [Canna indica]